MAWCASKGRSPRSPPILVFNGGDYMPPPRKGIEAYGMVWLGWLYSQEWWRREMWKINNPDRTLEQEIENRRRTFFQNNDANDLILQARTWQRHDVGTTPGLDGDVQRALRSITVPVLYMPSETDLYFPSATRGSRRSSSRMSPSSRFRRSGGTRPGRAAIPRIARFSTRTSAVSSPANHPARAKSRS
jgi:homoserine acetyltransferase